MTKPKPWAHCKFCGKQIELLKEHVYVVADGLLTVCLQCYDDPAVHDRFYTDCNEPEHTLDDHPHQVATIKAAKDMNMQASNNLYTLAQLTEINDAFEAGPLTLMTPEGLAEVPFWTITSAQAENLGVEILNGPAERLSFVDQRGKKPKVAKLEHIRVVG